MCLSKVHVGQETSFELDQVSSPSPERKVPTKGAREKKHHHFPILVFDLSFSCTVRKCSYDTPVLARRLVRDR